jgi:VanZ family protein
MNLMRDHRFNRVLALFWMSLIFLLSCQSNLPIRSFFWSQDKLEHALAFGILGLFFSRSFRPREEALPFTRVLLITVMVAAFGGFDEAHQHLVSGREASIGDLAADAIGGFVAAIIFWRR